MAEKTIKNNSNFSLLAKTIYGLEKVLAKELETLGALEIEVSNRAVSFKGDMEMMYRANYNLRTAINILKPIETFVARSEDELYKKVYEINWEKYLSLDTTFALETTVHSTIFKHSHYVALKTKDAIVDQFRNAKGKRPYIDTENPDIKIHLHISETKCTISLNSSGEPLFKRGYRVATVEAPLNEVLAAGLLALSGWQPSQNLLDPMCGSGTILIEAALIAKGIPPGVFRKKYGFETWPDFDEQLFQTISNDEKEEFAKKEIGKIIGLDILPKATSAAKQNVKNAFLNNVIEINTADCLSYLPNMEPGIIITNPPYGERLKEQNITQFYSSFADTLKRNYAGYDAWVISSNMESMKFIGLHPTVKYKLFNGPLECSFAKYSIYAGSKKRKYNE
jgi:putative N6-adenine-specific DNA methylase